MTNQFFTFSEGWDTGISLEEANQKELSAQLKIAGNLIHTAYRIDYHTGVGLVIRNPSGEEEEVELEVLLSKTEMMVELVYHFETLCMFEQDWQEIIPSHFIVGYVKTGLSVKTPSLVNAIEELNLWVFDMTCGKYDEILYLDKDAEGQYLICWYLERDKDDDEVLLSFEIELCKEIRKAVEAL